jgi:hypothetical protein
VRRADPDDNRKTQLHKFRLEVVVLEVVEFVDHENNRARGAAELGRQLRIERQESVLGIDDKKHDIRVRHGVIRRPVRGLGEVRVRRGPDAAGIDDAEGGVAQLANRFDPIAGHAGLVVHDGDAPPRETVEEGGFPDIRAPDENGLFHSALAAPPIALMPRHV